MRVENKIEKDGNFWLPENPDNQLPGTLIITNGGIVKLDLRGHFSEGTEIVNPEHPFKILGKLQGNKRVILEGCYYTRWPAFRLEKDDIVKSSLIAHAALVGGYYQETPLKFHSFTFKVDGLDEWINTSGIKVKYGEDHRTAEISYEPQDSIEHEIDDGIKLIIQFGYTLPGGQVYKEAKITQSASIKLVSGDGITLQKFISYAEKIKSFIAFAVDENIALNQVHANHDNPVVPSQIDIYYQSRYFSEIPLQIERREFLFSYPEIRSNFVGILNKWFDLYEKATPAMNLYFSTRANKTAYIQTYFLTLIQGVETFHRRISPESWKSEEEFEKWCKQILDNCDPVHEEWLRKRIYYGNELPLAKRVKRMIAPFVPYFGNSEQRGRLVRKIVDTRNYLTHYDKSLEDKIARGQSMVHLSDCLEVLLQLNICKFIGFSDEQIGQIIKNSHRIQRKLKIDLNPIRDYFDL